MEQNKSSVPNLQYLIKTNQARFLFSLKHDIKFHLINKLSVIIIVQ